MDKTSWTPISHLLPDDGQDFLLCAEYEMTYMCNNYIITIKNSIHSSGTISTGK